jgi:hypothetical protein
MQSDLDLFEKKLRYKKMDAAKDELQLSKLKLEHKIVTIDKEIILSEQALDKLHKEISALEQGEQDG